MRRRSGTGRRRAVEDSTTLHESARSPAGAGLGQGSTFTIALPLPAVRLAAQPGEVRLIPTGRLARLDGLVALIVDDGTDARELIGQVARLAKAGRAPDPAGA